MPRPASPTRSWIDTFVEHESRLFAYALFLTRHVHDAEDLLQAAMMRTMSQTVAPEQRLAYLFRALRNGATDALRRSARTPRTLDVSTLRDVIGPGNPGAATPAHRLHEAIAATSDLAQEIIMLKHCSGRSLRDISGLLDCPLGTVASTYRRALEQMSEHLREERVHEHR